MAAINKNGQPINIGDAVSIIGKVVSVGNNSFGASGSLAKVTVQSPLDTGTYIIQANDARAVEQSLDANHVARSIEGNAYGTAGDDLTVLGVCTATSGSGVNAVLTVLLTTSQALIKTAAGNCSSDNV